MREISAKIANAMVEIVIVIVIETTRTNIATETIIKAVNAVQVEV